MAERLLVVVLHDRLVGLVRQTAAGNLSFEYDPAYRADPDSTPLSLSMPKTVERHPKKRALPFLQGMLPDSRAVIDAWARQYAVSPDNPFALLEHVGFDVAGAAQFLPVRALQEPPAPDQLELLLEADIERRLRAMVQNRPTWGGTNYRRGQFSLAGAQAKLALHRTTLGTWGVPSGSLPTTHILKPAMAGLVDQDINEFLCLRAAKHLGMAAATVDIQTFGSERAFVTERFDRGFDARGKIFRVHQEDFCQSLAVSPQKKYESDGGPGVRQILNLLRDTLTLDDRDAALLAFIKGLAFNWIVAAPDAHAKNYSIRLLGPRVELAPLYDISSALPYPDEFPPQRLELAMAINGKSGMNVITGSDWDAIGQTAGLDRDHVRAEIGYMLSAVGGAFAAAAAALPATSRTSPIAKQLPELVASRAIACQHAMGL